MKKHNIIISLILIIAIIFVLGLFNINLPGIYFDSAITDYLATYVVNPLLGEKTTMLHTGLPLLGGVYHGSISAFLQIVILHFFQASPMSLRIPYLIYYAIDIALVYLILVKVTSLKMALAGSTILAGMIYCVTLPRTQYDIMLPGVCFFLLSVYLLISKWEMFKSENTQQNDLGKYSLLIGICSGLAFYDYFSFLFLTPVFIISFYILKKKNCIWIEIPYFIGLFAGSVLYFIGYADSILTNILGRNMKTILCLIFFAFIFFIILRILFWGFQQEKEIRKKSLKIIIIGTLCVVVIAVLILLPIIKEKLGQIKLNVFGIECSLLKRACYYFIHLFRMISDVSSEEMINGRLTSIMPMILIISFITIQLIYYITIKKRDKLYPR